MPMTQLRSARTMTPSSPTLSRRDILKTAGLAAAAVALGGPAAARGVPPSIRPAPGSRGRTRVLRLAHLTDIHVQPERRGGEGLAACLRHVQSLPDAPQLILTGGDLVMDTFEQRFDRSKALWDLFTGTFKRECSIPVEHCLGNHDIWGWNKSKSGTIGTEPGWGKKWACETLGLERPYRSFDRAGWHMIVLDSVHPDGESGYIGRLDEAQRDWLERDLAAVRPEAPVLVLTHIPILAACAFFDNTPDEERTGKWTVPGGNMMADGRSLVQLFRRHRNVKACLSGHIHLIDRVEFNGVTHICDGAVCGAWWKGPREECHEGYGVVDLYDDGTIEHEYVLYGWKAGE